MKTITPCSGFSSMSLVDWPGKVAAVIFLGRCNFRCPWCHNPDLVGAAQLHAPVSPGRVLQYLGRRREVLDGLVVTGGEPTLFPDLIPLLSRVRETGLPVKLDTNGSRPELVRRLLDQGLVHTVAVDYKLPLRLYEEVIRGGNAAGVAATIGMVLDRGCGWVRTTVVPGLHTRELLAEMVDAFPGLNGTNHRLQGFRPGSCLDPGYNGLPPVTPAQIRRLAEGLWEGTCGEG